MRARGGLVFGLLFGLLLLLCAGGGTGAFLLVTKVEGRGADTAIVAVETLLAGVYRDTDAEQASEFLCAEVDPVKVTQKIDEVEGVLREHPAARYGWEVAEKSRSRSKVVFDVSVEARDEVATVATERLEITTVANGGWRVCGLKRVTS